MSSILVMRFILDEMVIQELQWFLTLLLKTQHICYISYNKSDIVIVGAAAAVQTQADCLVA